MQSWNESKWQTLIAPVTGYKPNLDGKTKDWEDMGKDRKTILKWTLGKYYWRLDCTHIAQEKDRIR